MKKDNQSWGVLSQAFRDVGASLWRFRLWHGVSNQISAPISVPKDFFGINIATSDDPRFDDYIEKHLKQLNVDCVRIDFSYDAFDSFPQRLLDRMIAEGYDVLLNVFPPLDEAPRLVDNDAAQQKWQAFLEKVFADYHDKITLFEIGNTPNRKKWSGFDLVSYMPAWSIAKEAANSFDIRLAGPNISDFEPPYNVAFLQAMSRSGRVPEVHTDNLFVERVVEPEAYDHRILGRWMTNFLGFNLIKKARVIDAIGKDAGCASTYSTYKMWTVKRLSRWTSDPEQKQADYLVRYLVLAATSGGLDRAYWGPLIDNRDGIIDDGAQGYPYVDNVSHYQRVRGNFDDLRPRRGLKALQHVATKLSGFECIQGVSANNGISHFIFNTGSGSEVHICWCRDSYALPLKKLYTKLPDNIVFYNVIGEKLNHVPSCFSEQPLYLNISGSEAVTRPSRQQIMQINDLKEQNIRVTTSEGWQCVPYENAEWCGVVAAEKHIDFNDAVAVMLPEALEQAEVGRVLRDKRNKVWSIDTATHGTVTVKLNRVNQQRKIAYRFRDSKGKRHWNNASIMLRKGVATPRPLSFFERHQLSGIQDSYYVCEYLEDTFSSRDVFASITSGESSFRGVENDEWLKIIAEFICHMHNKGILHRDLSSGNILLTQDADGQATPYLIDIGRARTELKMTPRRRMIDLMRICYKLTWPEREKLMNYYDQCLGRPVASWWRYAVKFYEGKQKSKRWLKSSIKDKFR